VNLAGRNIATVMTRRLRIVIAVSFDSRFENCDHQWRLSSQYLRILRYYDQGARRLSYFKLQGGEGGGGGTDPN
jgi:hypothetical protein